MLRILLTYLLPFLLPFVAYGIYLLLMRHERELTSWPVFTLTIAGLMLCGGSLVYWALNDGSPPGGTYLPPSYQDGEIVPGRFVDDGAAADDGRLN